jgi:hypothetical protein
VNRALANADDRVADMEGKLERFEYIERLASDPRHLEMGAEEPAERRHDAPRSETRDQALRTVERYADQMDDGKAGEVETLIRRDRPHDDVLSRYVSAVGNPAYHSAFSKICEDPSQILRGPLPWPSPLFG